MSHIESAIVWRGVSLLDGVTPIVVVVTGIGKGSSNSKTGAMAQSYILVAGWSAKQAIHNGSDFAICGDCPMRARGPDGKDRACYVSLATGLSQVTKRLMVGGYPVLALKDASRALSGQQLRVGTYGDPAAVPPEVWQALLSGVSSWTGYTHQWRTHPDLKNVCMASVDTEQEYHRAKALGWRTFRVRKATELATEPLLSREIVCPASAEAGHRVTCEECRLCKGTSRPARDIAIIDHSIMARSKLKRQLTVLQERTVA